MYIKTAKDCTEKKEIIHSQKHETLLKEKSTLVWRRTIATYTDGFFGFPMAR